MRRVGPPPLTVPLTWWLLMLPDIWMGDWVRMEPEPVVASSM